MPRFSVVIPAYNRAYILPRAIASVAAQTETDWELIIVDDGGSDNTEELTKSYNDKRITYTRQDNAGPGMARNRGMDMAQGEWITYLDSDDLFYPRFLATIKNCRGHYGICAHERTITFLNSDGSVRSEKKDPNNQTGTLTLQDFYDWKVKTTSSGLFHLRGAQAIWRDVFIEDLDFILQLAANDPDGFSYIPDTLVDYNQAYNGDGLCSQATYGTYAKAFGQIYEWHKNDPLMKNPDVYLGRVKKYTELQERMDAGLEIPLQYKYFPELWENQK